MHYENISSQKMRANNYILFGILLLLLFPIIIEMKKMRGSRRKTRKNNLSRQIIVRHNIPLKGDHIENGAKIIKASHFDYEFFLGHKIKFICVAQGDPMPRITWFKDGIEIFAHPYLHIADWRIDKFVIKSKLEIDPARQMDSGTYECQANNRHTVDSRMFKADF